MAKQNEITYRREGSFYPENYVANVTEKFVSNENNTVSTAQMRLWMKTSTYVTEEPSLLKLDAFMVSWCQDKCKQNYSLEILKHII